MSEYYQDIDTGDFARGDNVSKIVAFIDEKVDFISRYSKNIDVFR